MTVAATRNLSSAGMKGKLFATTLLSPIAWVLYAFLFFAIWVVIRSYDVTHAKVSSPPQLSTMPSPGKPSSGGDGSVALDEKLEHEEEAIDQDRQKLELQQKYVESRAAEIDKRADDLGRLISQMTIVGTLYSFMVGVFAFFSLKAVRADADRELGKITSALDDFKKNEFAEFKIGLLEQSERLIGQSQKLIERSQAEFDIFKAEVRADIPDIYGMERSLGVILERVRRNVDMSANWTLRATYEGMDTAQRQKVLLAEMTTASFDYFGLLASKRHSSAVGQIFLSLANFYAARSRVVDSQSRYNQDDMRRAMIYIDRACSVDPENGRNFSQRAAMLLVDVPRKDDKVSPDKLDLAETDLLKSLQLNAQDSRALYNLAWILRRQGKLEQAIDLLTKVIDGRNSIPAVDRGRRMVDALTNRACYRVLVVINVPGQGLRESGFEKIARFVLADCHRAWKEAKKHTQTDYCWEGFQREFGKNGELFSVLPYISKLRPAIARVVQKVQPLITIT